MVGYTVGRSAGLSSVVPPDIASVAGTSGTTY